MPEAIGNHSTFFTRRALLSRGAAALPAATLVALPVAAIHPAKRSPGAAVWISSRPFANPAGGRLPGT